MADIKAEYLSHMGNDLTVVNAARVSFSKASEYVYDKINDNWYVDHSDQKLISYLARHNHWTPFSHPQITLRETVPIFVARQRFKHMVGFTYNEVSRRYVDDEPEFYEPKVWRKRAENVKQGSGEEFTGYVWSEDEIGVDTGPEGCLEYIHRFCLHEYQQMLKAGVAPEQARMVLPQSMMTSYYVTGSLAAFARAYKQRSDSHSQREIQDLAAQWDSIIRPLFPVSWAALTHTN